MSETTRITGLDPIYITMIQNLLVIESQSLDRMAIRRDRISVQKNTYAETRTMLSDLQKITQSMISTDAFYDFDIGRKKSITPTQIDTTVASATVSDSTAVGDYDISVTTLAKAQRRASASQAGTDIPLGLSGDFWLGGSGTASVAFTPNTSVTAAATASVSDGWSELGTSTYEIEIQEFNGVMKFRLKDIDGRVVAIDDQSDEDDSLTTSWQTVTAGEYDSKRGLTLTFGDPVSTSTTAIDYTAAGVSITVEESDNLINIASKINNADQSYGRGIEATVVGDQLILSAANTGTNHTMIYADNVGLGISAVDLQSAVNASFSVNNISFTRSSNTNLTDVIAGVTLNLANDAEGKSAKLTISADYDPAKSVVNDFLENFNNVTRYLEEKTAITKVTLGETTTYNRGVLADDYIFNDLRSSLFSKFISNHDNSSAFQSLRDIGITMTDSLTATISDEAAFTQALQDDFNGVTTLLDTVMAEIDNTLERFTDSTSGYIEGAIDTFENEVTTLNFNITDETERLQEREDFFFMQFAEMQAQITMLSYTSQQWSTIYGSTNRYL